MLKTQMRVSRYTRYTVYPACEWKHTGNTVRNTGYYYYYYYSPTWRGFSTPWCTCACVGCFCEMYLYSRSVLDGSDEEHEKDLEGGVRLSEAAVLRLMA